MPSGNAIVILNVAEQLAPAPNNLQRTGAFVSQGGTNTAPGTLTLLNQLSDLTGIQPAPLAVTSISQTGGTATVTTASPHGLPASETVNVTISGAAQTNYNGTHAATVTSTTQFTYTVPSGTVSPATGTIKWTPGDVSELLAMGTTFFAQGNGVGVYVLELGVGDADDGVSALSTYITDNPNLIYRWLVPREWDANASFLALVATFESLTAKTYFHVTTTINTYTSYTAQMKSVMAWVEAPSIPAIEFTAAADFYVALNYNPSTANRVTPNAFAFLFGVTPYPTAGNGALFSALKAASINWVGTGAEGQLSNLIAFWGTMMDGHDLTWWYSVDWVQIHVEADLAAAVIDGSNNPQNPLYYDQNGINRLQAVAQGTMNQGVSVGVVLAPAPGEPAVTAVPFNTYVALNPQDYPVGTYNGLAVTYTPNRGFKSITFNVTVSDIPLA